MNESVLAITLWYRHIQYFETKTNINDTVLTDCSIQ